MDELIAELAKQTLTFYSGMEQASYEQFVEFVDKREQIMNRMREISMFDSVKDKHRDTIRNLLKHDEAILAQMSALKNEAMTVIANVARGRKQRNAYNPAYTPDGVFLDKKE